MPRSMRGPLTILLGVLAAVGVAALVLLGGDSGSEAADCGQATPLRASALARTLEPRYGRRAIGEADLDDVFEPLAAELPAGVTYEAQLLLRGRRPVGYLLVMNSSDGALEAGEVYEGFAKPAGGPARELEMAGATGRIRRLTGGFSSILATGGCAAITVGSASEPAVLDISRRLRLP